MAFESLLHDFRLALRGLVREPGYSLVAILILAIGIGANTAVFSVVNPLVLKPLPFRDADRLVWIANTGRGEGLSGKTYRVAAYEELARNNRSFESLTAYFAFFGYFSYTLTGSGEPERLVGVQVAPGFLEQLGIRPQLGRGFVGDEWKSNGPGAALITAGLWKRRFGGDPAIVGRPVTINETPYVVTGVLPEDFDFGSSFTPGTRVDMLVPARLEEMRNWGNTLAIIGRLKPGVTVEQARAEFATLVPPIEKALDYQFGTAMSSLKTHVSGPMRRALIVLWAAVGLVLLIVCANLSNLLLARTASRAKEFAVRIALGSSRLRIVSQLMVEGVVLAVCGAVIGVPLAYVLTARAEVVGDAGGAAAAPGARGRDGAGDHGADGDRLRHCRRRGAGAARGGAAAAGRVEGAGPRHDRRAASRADAIDAGGGGGRAGLRAPGRRRACCCAASSTSWTWTSASSRHERRPCGSR